MKITKEWLKKKETCKPGYKWFARNFPDGLIVNKKNIKILYKKLLKRQKPFQNVFPSIVYDSWLSLDWLLDMIFDVDNDDFFKTYSHSDLDELVDAWWEAYKDLKK